MTADGPGDDDPEDDGPGDDDPGDDDPRDDEPDEEEDPGDEDDVEEELPPPHISGGTDSLAGMAPKYTLADGVPVGAVLTFYVMPPDENDNIDESQIKWKSDAYY